MLNNVGGYDVPITLKQLEKSAITPKQEALIQDTSPGKILDSFGNILKKQLEETNTLNNDANQAKEAFAVGGNMSLHELMIKTEKAEMAMQMTLQLRNKLLTAYKEIQNMHV